jgi:hypothetical protein
MGLNFSLEGSRGGIALVNSSLKTACLVAGVATTWGSAQALEARGLVFNLTDQGPMHFMYNTGSSGAYSGALMRRDVTGASFFPWDFEEKPFTADLSFQPIVWGTIGWIGENRVSVGVLTSLGDGISGQPWETVFPGFSEAAIAAAVLANDYATLGNFFATFSGTFSTPYANGASARLVNFSVGTLTGNVTLVPEPATLAMLGIGVAALLRRRRR